MVIRVDKWCPFCGKKSTLIIDKERYNRWQSGELIQNVFPELPAEERETIISGMCAKCQYDFF